MKKQIYFMHVPKVAGTSVNSVFSNYFGEDEVVLHCENKKCDLQSYSFVSGHVAWPTFRAIIDGADAYKFTIMRDPIDHLLSHLRWVWRLCALLLGRAEQRVLLLMIDQLWVVSAVCLCVFSSLTHF